MEDCNYIMHEITPLSDRDCFYIADRRKRSLLILSIAMPNMN